MNFFFRIKLFTAATKKLKIILEGKGEHQWILLWNLLLYPSENVHSPITTLSKTLPVSLQGSGGRKTIIKRQFMDYTQVLHKPLGLGDSWNTSLIFPSSNRNYSVQEDLKLIIISESISNLFALSFYDTIQTVSPSNSSHLSAEINWPVCRIWSTAFFPEQTGNSCLNHDRCSLNKWKFPPASSVLLLWLLKKDHAFSADTHPFLGSSDKSYSNCQLL